MGPGLQRTYAADGANTPVGVHEELKHLKKETNFKATIMRILQRPSTSAEAGVRQGISGL